MPSAIPYDLLMTIQRGTMAYRYRDRPMLKNPFDLALYPLLLAKLRPRTIIEIGSFQGGSALWFADTARNLGLDAHVHSVDIARVSDLADSAVTFYQGNGRTLSDPFKDAMLSGFPRPWLVIEDADHQYETTIAALRFFDQWLVSGDYIIVEDGILTDMLVEAAYDGGPDRAVQDFLASAPDRYVIDRSYCDYFGENVTWNINGYLRRL